MPVAPSSFIESNMKRRFTREEAPMYNELMDKYEMKKKSIWPYTEMYKGHEMRVFADGSVNVVAHDLCCGDLTEAFAYIDNLKKEKMNIVECCVGTEWSLNNFSLAPCTPQVCNTVPCQKGNNPMYVDNDKHIESSKINYLQDRIQAVYYNKERPLMKQFNLVDDDAPATSQELVDRFVSGKFVFKDASKKDTKGFFYRPLENIRWRDPAVKEDQAGFDAAWVAFTKVYQDAKDTVAIGTPAEGLAAVKALDAWTLTV